MSIKDFDNWPLLKKVDCACCYCSGNWNFYEGYDLSIKSTRKLLDNEIFYFHTNSIGQPGCLKEKDTLPAPPMTNQVNSGLHCTKCNDFNGFAEPNLPNGKFVCFTCR